MAIKNLLNKIQIFLRPIIENTPKFQYTGYNEIW